MSPARGWAQKIQARNLPCLAGFVTQVEGFRDWGIRTSPSHTFVTVALLTLAFLTFVLDAGKMAASRTATHTVSDLLTKIKQK